MEPRNPITQGKLNLCFYEIDAKKAVCIQRYILDIDIELEEIRLLL